MDSEYVISSMYQLIKLDCSCATSFAPLLTTSQLSRRRGDLPDLVHFSPSSSVRGDVSSHVIYLLLLSLLLLLLLLSSSSLLLLSLLFTIGKGFSKSYLHITTLTDYLHPLMIMISPFSTHFQALTLILLQNKN